MPVAQVTVQNSFCDVLIDAADAHGIILDSSGTTSGGAGLMKTFRFEDDEQNSRHSLAEAPIPAWQCSYFRSMSLVEYIDRLGCMAPLGWPVGWPSGQTWNPIAANGRAYWTNLWRDAAWRIGDADVILQEFSDGRGTYSPGETNEFMYSGEVSGQNPSPTDEPNMHLLYAAAAGQHLAVGGQSPVLQWTWNSVDGRVGWALTIPVQLPVALDSPNYFQDEGEEGEIPWEDAQPVSEAFMHDIRRATLWWRAQFVDAWTPVWQPQSIRNLRVSKDQSTVLSLKWETLDGHFVFRTGNETGEADVYYIPEDRRWNWDAENQQLNLAYPSVRQSFQWVYIGGHQGAFCCRPIAYPYKYRGGDLAGWGWGQGVNVILNDFYSVDHSIFLFRSRNSQAPNVDEYDFAVDWRPRNASGQEADGTKVVAQAFLQPAEGESENTVRYYRPVVQFLSEDKFKRSCAYSLTVDWPSTISARVTVPANVQYDTNVEKTLVHANGSSNADWRNANCNLKLLVPKASADAVAAKCKANSHVHVDAGYYYTSDADVTVQVTGRQFTGRIADRAIVRSPANMAMSVIELPLRDDFSRLEKHPWAFLGNFETTTVGHMFVRALAEVGVQEADIDIRLPHLSDGRGLEEILTVEPNKRRSKPRHEFGEEANFIECMNQMVEACGLRWGQDENGLFFLDYPSLYIESTVGGGQTPSTISYTIDDDETTVDDLVWELQLSSGGQTRKGGRGFVNAVMCVLDRDGRREVAWQRNVDSMQVGTTADYVGDVWTHVFSGTDENTVEEQARRIMDERMRKGKTLHFRVNGKPLLLPDEYVKLNATGLGGVSHDIFTITEKNWEVNGQQYKADFTAEWVATEVS